MLDLSHIHLGEARIARFAVKRDANLFAKAHGWYQSSIIRAFNRFQIFYVIGDRLPDELRLATLDGTATFPYRRSNQHG